MIQFSKLDIEACCRAICTINGQDPDKETMIDGQKLPQYCAYIVMVSAVLKAVRGKMVAAAASSDTRLRVVESVVKLWSDISKEQARQKMPKESRATFWGFIATMQTYVDTGRQPGDIVEKADEQPNS